MNAPRSSPNRRPGQFKAGSGRGELPLWAVLVVASGVLVLGIGGSSTGGLSLLDPERNDALVNGGELIVEAGTADSIARHGAHSPRGDKSPDGVHLIHHDPAASLVALEGAREALGGESLTGESGSDPVNQVHTLLAVENLALESLEDLIADGTEGSSTTPWQSGLDRAGLREEGNYQHGVRHGLWKSWRENGALRSRGWYVNGLREGNWESFSDSGALLSELTYEAGSRSGDWLLYSESGSILEEGQYSENSATGRWTTYYSGGQIKERGLFVSGLREGHWEFYDDLGLLTLEAGEYRAGIKVQ